MPRKCGGEREQIGQPFIQAVVGMVIEEYWKLTPELSGKLIRLEAA